MATVVDTVEIGFEKAIAGTFRLDISKLDSSDVLSGAFTQFFTGAYDDVSADVDALPLVRRGRDDQLVDMQQGELELVLSRPASPEFYNPNAPSSPLAALNPGFKPMRPVRWRRTVNGTTYPVFYGFLRSAVYDPETRLCTIHANDLFLWLSRVYPTIASAGPTTTGAAIGKILDAADWTDPTLRQLDAGDAISDFSADGSQTALQLITSLLEAERGVFFVSAAGAATYQDRHARAKRTTPAAILYDAVTDLGSSFDLDAIKNRATVTKTGGAEQSSQNTVSVQTYGPSDYAAIDTPYLADDAAANGLADYLVSIAATPRPPIACELDSDDEHAVQQVTLELGDRVRVSESLGGTSGDFHIEQIEQTLEPASGYLVTRYRCTARGPDAFILDSSALDSTSDLLTY